MHGNDSNVERCAKHCELRQGRVPGAGALRFSKSVCFSLRRGFDRRGLVEAMVTIVLVAPNSGIFTANAERNAAFADAAAA